MNKGKQYKIVAAGTAPELYPTETFFCILYYDNENAIEIPKQYPFHHGWGKVADYSIMLRDSYPMPFKLDMVWLSIIEKQFYSIEKELSSERMAKTWDSYDFVHILIGMAPYGLAAIWFVNEKKSVLVDRIQAEPIEVGMHYFLPSNPDYKLSEYCNEYINNDSLVKENLEKNGLPPRHLYDKYMQQFIYRYLPLFEHWDEDKEEWKKYSEEEVLPEFDFIEEALFDGTHDKLHDGGLMNYHEAGKPKKLAIQWHFKKSDYSAYFWFEDDEICAIFDRFYGAHPETQTDFIIRIDAEKNKYELALYRYGLKEPQIICESAYQLIVFKNKFEYYRSENYNQPRGAWIW